MNKIIKFGGALVIVLLAGSGVQAQQEKIQDQDLLNLLESVNEEATTAKSAPKTPVDRVQVAVDVAEERATETDVVMGEEDPATEADTVVVEEDSAAEADAVVVESVFADTNAVMDSLEIATDEEIVGTSEGNLISVRLNRVGLEEAINLFAQLSGANIIVPELTEAAQISVNLKDVEWRPALQSILDTYDYELYQKVSGSNVYSVRRRPAGAPEPQVVETFKLKYATVPNAAALIRELIPTGAKVSEFASRNMIVVKSTESSLGEIRAVLDSIDEVRQQVYIESKFMELTDDAQKDLGIDWSVLQGFGFGTEGDTRREYSKDDSDTRTSTRFTDANGLPYEESSGYTDQGQRIPGSGIFTLEGLTPTVQNTTTKATTDVLTSVLSADEFRMVLSALEQNKGVNVVSNPKIIVANEEMANISIIRKEPNLKQSRQQALNDTPDTITFELDQEQPFFEFGIKLDVIPSINTSSNITVKINPSLTRKFADKPAGENTYPIIDEKSIQTVFNLSSGQTAAIGGLTEVTEGEEEKKIPVLGSIPFLGRLFSWKQTIRGQDETIIFVTVGLADTELLKEGTGLPSDAELSRRQIIRDSNSFILREQGREFYEAEQADKLEEMMKVMRKKEDERIEQRLRALEKQQEKAARQGGGIQTDVASTK